MEKTNEQDNSNQQERIVYRFAMNEAELIDITKPLDLPGIVERIKPDDTGEFDEGDVEFCGIKAVSRDVWAKVHEYHSTRASVHAALADYAEKKSKG